MRALLIAAALRSARAVNNASAGCGNAPPLTPGAVQQKFTIDVPDANPIFPEGVANRSFWLWLPASYREPRGNISRRRRGRDLDIP